MESKPTESEDKTPSSQPQPKSEKKEYYIILNLQSLKELVAQYQQSLQFQVGSLCQQSQNENLQP